MTVTAIDTPPPDMTSSEGRVAHMRNWVDQIEAELAALTVQRDALWQAIAVLDPDALSSRPAPAAKVWPTPAEVGAKIDAASMPSASPKPKPSKHRDRSDRNTGNRPGPRSDKPDYPTVAVEIRRLLDAGEPVTPGLAATFGVPATSVKNWMTRCRQLGLLDGAAPARKGRRSSKPAATVPKPKPEARVTPISSAKSAAKTDSVKPKRDWVEIAGHIHRLRDDGVSVQDALAKLYKVPSSTAKGWMKHCRESGLVKPLEAGLKVIEDNTGLDNTDAAVYVAAQVAEFYLKAIRTNHRPIQFVADSVGIDKAQAIDWVRRARADGALPATSIEPQLPEAERRALLDMAKPEPVA